MNQAAAIQTQNDVRAHIERSIRKRFGSFMESSIQRMIDEELREFERDLPHFNRAQWLQAVGLGAVVRAGVL